MAGTELDMVRAAVLVAQCWEGEYPAPAAAVKLVAMILRDADAENATYKAALEEIADARGDLCDQTPYWAAKALGRRTL